MQVLPASVNQIADLSLAAAILLSQVNLPFARLVSPSDFKDLILAPPAAMVLSPSAGIAIAIPVLHVLTRRTPVHIACDVDMAAFDSMACMPAFDRTWSVKRLADHAMCVPKLFLASYLLQTELVVNAIKRATPF